MAEIKLKIVIDGKEALATLDLTEKEIGELNNSFRNAEVSQGSFSNGLNASLENARNAIQGMKEVWGVFTEMFAGSVAAYQEAEIAEIQLETAMKQRGSYTEEAMQDLQDYAANLQATTTVEGDSAIALMGKLQAMGLNNEQTKIATKLGADLAALMGTDLASTSKVLADLFAGDATMIKRYVKGLDEAVLASGDTNAIMQMLNQSVGGQAEALASASSGPMKQFENAFGDLTEAVGGTISTAIMPFVQAGTSVITSLNSISPAITGVIGVAGMLTAALIVLKTTGLMGNITSLLAYRGGLAGLIPAITGNTVATGLSSAAHIGFGGAVRVATTAVKGFLASNPLGWAIIGVTAVWSIVEALDLFSDKQDEAKEKQKAYYDSLSLADLRKEYDEFGKAQAQTSSRLYEVQREITKLANTDYRTSQDRAAAQQQLNLKNQELADLRVTLNKLAEHSSQISSQILEKEKAIKEQMEGQVNAIKERLEKLGKSEKDSKLLDLEKRYKSDTEAIKLTVKDEIEKINLLKKLDEELTSEKNKLNEKEIKDKQAANKKINDDFKQRQKLIKDLEFELTKEKATNYDQEIIELDKWYDTKYEIAKNNKDLISALDEVYSIKRTKIELEYEPPVTELPDFTPDDINITDQQLQEYEKLERLRLESIENEYSRLRAIADYEYQLEIEKNGDLESLKIEHANKIKDIDAKQNEAMLQNTTNTLTTIGAAFGKHTAMYKATAIAQTTIATYQSATEAYKSAAGIPGIGFILAPIAAAAALASGIANIAAITSTETPGYAKGGLLPKGEKGYIEGYHDEIIAPKDTFVDVLNSSIIPKLQVDSGSTSNRQLEQMITKMDRWQTKLSVIMDTDDVNKNLKKNDRFISRNGYY